MRGSKNYIEDVIFRYLKFTHLLCNFDIALRLRRSNATFKDCTRGRVKIRGGNSSVLKSTNFPVFRLRGDESEVFLKNEAKSKEILKAEKVNRFFHRKSIYFFGF